MTTLTVTLDESEYQVDIETVQNNSRDKKIMLHASGYQPDLKEGDITHVLFEIDGAKLSIRGDDAIPVQDAATAGMPMSLIYRNQEVEIEGEQFS